MAGASAPPGADWLPTFDEPAGAEVWFFYGICPNSLRLPAQSEDEQGEKDGECG